MGVKEAPFLKEYIEQRQKRRIEQHMRSFSAEEAEFALIQSAQLPFHGVGERDRLKAASPVPTSHGPTGARAHRYPGVKPAPPAIPHRHTFPNIPSACPFAVPELDQPRLRVDHKAQRHRISEYAKARSAARRGSAESHVRATHQAAIEENRSRTRPAALHRGTPAVVRKEVERIRAAKGLPPPGRLCNRPCS